MATLPQFMPNDPISVSVASSIAGFTLIRSDLSNNFTFTQTSANVVTLSGALAFSSLTPATTTDALYQNTNQLFWNGNPVHSSGVTTVAFASTVNLDMTTIPTKVARLTLTGTCTLNITNGYDGQQLLLEILQNGTGTYVLTTGTGWAFGTDITSYTNTLTASKRDLVGLEWISSLSKAIVVGINHGN